MSVDLDDEFDMDITGLDHGAVLAALYNAAKPVGLGFMVARSEEMTPEEGAEYLRDNPRSWVDYVHGRPIKVGFEGNVLLRYDLYDRDQGAGKARSVINSLRGAK